MKRKLAVLCMGISLSTAVFGISAAAQESSTEAVTEAESETEQVETEKAEDFSVTADDTSTEVENLSGTLITETNLEDGTLTLTEESGTVHTFLEIEDTAWTEPVLWKEFGFFYLTYTNADGEEQELSEEGEETELEEEATVYALTEVNIREQPDGKSEIVAIAKIGDEVTVTAAAPGWLKVRTGETEGYVSHRYFTESKEEVEEALAAEEAAQQANAAAAAAEAAAANAAASSAGTSASSGTTSSAASEEPYVVDIQEYDDCDGSGHGYREILYSDGSVVTEEY